MKKAPYFFYAFLLVCCMSLGWHPQKAQAKIYDTTSFTFTDTSITIRWADPYETLEGLDPQYYKILSYDIYDYYTDSWLKEGLSADAKSFKVKGLKKGYTGYWRIWINYAPVNGKDITHAYYDALYVNTTPKKVAKSNMKVFDSTRKEADCQFEVIKDTDMTGFQLQVYQGSEKIKTLKSTSYYTKTFKFKKNQVYKYRARQYYTNPDTNKKYYGAWSAYRYFTSPSITVKSTSDSKGAKLTFKKISGVKNYVVSVSTKSGKNYKKTSTVTVKDTSQSIRLTKIGDSSLKAKKTYYLKVVPMIKVGDDLVKSDIVYTNYFYNYK